MANSARLSLQEQLAQVQGRVPVAVEVPHQEVLPQEVVPKVAAAPATVVSEAKPEEKTHQSRSQPVMKEVKPEVIKQTPAKAPVQQERPVVWINLSEIRYIDLAMRVRADQKEGAQCQFLLRQGPSSVTFSLSCVGSRVRLCAREATGVFTSLFKKGTELFQDEIFPRDEKILPSEQRLAATTVFQDAMRSIQIRQLRRRQEEHETPKTFPEASKGQPGFRGQFGNPPRRNNREASGSSK